MMRCECHVRAHCTDLNREVVSPAPHMSRGAELQSEPTVYSRLSLKKKGKKAQVNLSTTDSPAPPYTDDEMIVHKLIQKQGKQGSVQDWIEPYNTEMQEVQNRRLTLLDDDEVTDVIRRDALPLRMILETKRDGRLKGRLVAIGYREPKYWDVKSNSSPVVSLSTVRALLFKAGLPSDVISSQ